ncbi:hypothetical protein PMIN02_013097 [Paraphaeosphaeria minitans]
MLLHLAVLSLSLTLTLDRWPALACPATHTDTHALPGSVGRKPARPNGAWVKVINPYPAWTPAHPLSLPGKLPQHAYSVVEQDGSGASGAGSGDRRQRARGQHAARRREDTTRRPRGLRPVSGSRAKSSEEQRGGGGGGGGGGAASIVSTV